VATKTTTTLTDDLDGSPADKTVSYSGSCRYVRRFDMKSLAG